MKSTKELIESPEMANLAETITSVGNPSFDATDQIPNDKTPIGKFPDTISYRGKAYVPSGKSLATKLAEVMAAVARIPKRGRNEYHGYDYATEADIAEAVRQELAARSLVIIPECDGVERSGDLTLTAQCFHILDGESGERQSYRWYGCGQDKGDKGLYKAYTGAEKYFLLKLFLMPTGDDPERDETAPAKKDDFIKRAPAPADGKLHVTDVSSKSGTKNGKTWTSYRVAFSDGKDLSTFDESLASRCRQYLESGAIVTRQTEQKGKYENLVACEPAEAPIYTLTKVQAKDGEGNGPWRLYVKGDEAIYITSDAMTADNADQAVKDGVGVSFTWVEKTLGTTRVREVERLEVLPL